MGRSDLSTRATSWWKYIALNERTQSCQVSKFHKHFVPFLRFHFWETQVLCKFQEEDESAEYFITFPHALKEHYNFTRKFHYENRHDKITCARKDQYISETLHGEKNQLQHIAEVSAKPKEQALMWTPTDFPNSPIEIPQVRGADITLGTHMMNGAENTVCGNVTEGFRCVLLREPPLKEQGEPAAEPRLLALMLLPMKHWSHSTSVKPYRNIIIVSRVL